MKTPNRLDERPNLEQMVQEANYRQREHAIAELQAGIARILQPRGGYQLVGGSGNKHFLPLPKAPLVAVNRLGMPDANKIDAKAQAAYQAELMAVTLKERELESMAQKAKNMVALLFDWAVELGKTEDRLLLSTVTEEDRPDVESYVREHKRFLRTAESWTAKLHCEEMK